MIGLGSGSEHITERPPLGYIGDYYRDRGNIGVLYRDNGQERKWKPPRKTPSLLLEAPSLGQWILWQVHSAKSAKCSVPSEPRAQSGRI